MKMESNEEMRPEYDFSNMKGGVRGKYVDRYQAGTNIVLLEPDVAQAFPASYSVNEALRLTQPTWFLWGSIIENAISFWV